MLVRLSLRALCLSLLYLAISPGCSASHKPEEQLKAATDSRTGPAGESPEAVARAYVQTFVAHASAESRVELAEKLATEDDANWSLLGTSSGQTRVDPDGYKVLVGIASEASHGLAFDLRQLENAQGEALEDLQASWQFARSRRNAAELELAEVNASRQVAGQLASLFSLDNRWFWLASVLAVTALVGSAAHDRRHEYRRAMYGARARSVRLSFVLQILLAAVVGITCVVFLFGSQLYDSLVSSALTTDTRTLRQMWAEVDTLKDATKELGPRAVKAEATMQQRLAGWAQSSASGDAELAGLWQDVRRNVLLRLIDNQVRGQVASALAEDVSILRLLTEERNQAHSSIARYRLLKWVFSLAMGMTLSGVVAGGAILFARGLRRRQHEVAETCPLCLGRGKFEVVGPSAIENRGKTVLELLRCNNVITQDPYEQCDFEFLSIYRDMPKLCFPTLGHPQAGKTHWLAMLYRELNRGNYKSNVHFEKVKSHSSEQFDRTVDEILNARLNPAATQTDRLPSPLIFNFCDRDPLGKSNLLVNIFDYSGEVTISRTIDDPHRRRALDADGYLFFLDPTYLSEPQADALVNFREDLRAVRKVRSGKAIRTPVALCVPKIDLLVNQPYADPSGGGSIAEFYRQLAAVDPTGEEMSLRVIEARSKLMRNLRDTIWPGWQIERQIHDLFGGRFMFFPLTPVGLSDLGESDLRMRMIEPFGLLEPLAWLLHMNGYPVLQ